MEGGIISAPNTPDADQVAIDVRLSISLRQLQAAISALGAASADQLPDGGRSPVGTIETWDYGGSEGPAKAAESVKSRMSRLRQDVSSEMLRGFSGLGVYPVCVAAEETCDDSGRVRRHAWIAASVEGAECPSLCEYVYKRVEDSLRGDWGPIRVNHIRNR